MTRWQKDLEGRGWNSNYLSNHDQPARSRALATTAATGSNRPSCWRTFLHMLQGTPYIYQGEEIGMTNVAFDSIEDYRDIESSTCTTSWWRKKGVDPQIGHGDHPCQKPRQRPHPHAVGCQPARRLYPRTPWIKVNPNYTDINVQQALADPNSIFYYYQQLIRLRKENPVIVYGRYDLLLAEDEQIYAFTRTLEDDRLLVMLNFTANTPAVDLPA